MDDNRTQSIVQCVAQALQKTTAKHTHTKTTHLHREIPISGTPEMWPHPYSGPHDRYMEGDQVQWNLIQWLQKYHKGLHNRAFACILKMETASIEFHCAPKWPPWLLLCCDIICKCSIHALNREVSLICS